MTLEEWCEQNNKKSLLKEWDYDGNTVNPTEITNGSGKKVWWKCDKGHKWQATICDRTRGFGCPYCSGRSRIKGINDLATTNPDLIKEWDYDKNVISPTEVAAGSNKKVWWKCDKGHEWKTQINSRTSGCGCPYCSGRLIYKGFNDLATTKPELLSEWDYDKNTISPTEVSAGSHKKIWWKCKEGHEWRTSVYNRTKGNGCSICKKQLIIEGINDLVTTKPILASEWDYDKNTIDPTKISASSDKKVWWKCQFGHEWKAQIRNRACGTKCPICNKEMKTSFPEQALFFYIKKYYPDAINSDSDTIGMELDIYIPSLKIAIEYDGGNWHKDKECELKKNKLCKDNDILLIRIREEGLELYDDCYCIIRTNISSNNSLSDVIKKVLFDIGNTSNIDINIDRDSTLIYNSYITIRKSRSLKNTYPEIAKEWHPTKNGKITPDMVYPRTNKKIWWIGNCGHEWQAVVSSRTNGCGCPVCNGKKIVSGINDLLTRRPDLCKEWYYAKNDEIGLFPNKVPPGTAKKAWWKCKTCEHVWQSTILSRAQGRGCPKCHNNFQKIQCIETGNIYNSLINAAKAIGLERGDKIGMCCKGKCKTAGGYHWKYYSKEIE